jgi:hypothetical protein
MEVEQNLEQKLVEICKKFKLKEKAFEILEKIISDGLKNDERFLNGYNRAEVSLVFDEYSYTIQKKYLESTIDTRIGLYIFNDIFLDNLEPIGYYVLEASFSGELVDDVFILEKEKLIDDVK